MLPIWGKAWASTDGILDSDILGIIFSAVVIAPIGVSMGGIVQNPWA